MHRSLLCMGIGWGAAALAHATVLVESRFDSGHEGWVAGNGVAVQGGQATGGNPGGYFFAADRGQGTVWVYQAPASFLGDLTAALDGTLSFDLRVSRTDFPMANDWGDVKFGGSGIELVTGACPGPGLSWTHYTVTLSPGAWHIGNMLGPVATAADFATVFANVEFLRIRGEFSALLDHGGLDNVVLAAIPEPHAAWLMVAGGIVLAGWSWRRTPRRPDA